MQQTPTTPPHLTSPASVGSLMRQVLYALVPGIIAMIYFFGIGPLVTLVVACIAALLAEALMLRLRQRPVGFFLRDGSAIVTAVLLALCLPPFLPWWITLIGVLFAIVIAKHLYGGLGHNPFNPAMVGYVVLLISFATYMTQWIDIAKPEQPSVSKTISIQFGFAKYDATSSATPLDTMGNELERNKTIKEIRKETKFQNTNSQAWTWINIAFALGGLWLLFKRVITWHTPAAVLGALAFIALLFNLYDSDKFTTPVFQLLSGGIMLGAFFIATDPVSSSTTVRGKLIYGAGIGALIYIIRTWGGYPDGIAFAVLILNMAVPTIDHYTQPRVFGDSKKG